MAMLSAGCDPRSPEQREAEWRARVTQAQDSLFRYNGGTLRLAEAQQRAQALLDERPDAVETNVLAAHALLFGGVIDDERFRGAARERAAAFLDNAERIDPAYCDTYLMRSDMFVGDQRAKAALAEVDRARARQCDGAGFDLLRGDALALLGERDDADAIFRRIVADGASDRPRQHARFMRALFAVAKREIALGDLERGRADALRFGQEAWPDDHWHTNNAVWLLRWAGDFDHAAQLGEISVRLSQMPAARSNLGIALYGQVLAREVAGTSTPDDAAAWARAKTLEPDTIRALHELGVGGASLAPAFRDAVLRRGRSLDPEFEIDEEP